MRKKDWKEKSKKRVSWKERETEKKKREKTELYKIIVKKDFKKIQDQERNRQTETELETW